MNKSRLININGEPFIETEIEDGFKYERLYNINMTLRQNDQVVASYRAEEMKTMIND